MNDTDLAFLFSEVARLSRKRFAHQMDKLHLTHAQSRTLLRLARYEGLRQVELARILEIQPITLVKQLDQLVEMGLIERRPDENDRRAFRLFLLPAADNVLNSIRSEVSEIMAQMSHHIEPEQMATFSSILIKMKKNLSEGTDET